MQERKQQKVVLSEVAKEFNETDSDWIRVAEDLQLELFERPATPEAVAKFLYTAQHLDKTEAVEKEKKDGNKKMVKGNTIKVETGIPLDKPADGDSDVGRRMRVCQRVI